jgi:hypothetical protein
MQSGAPCGALALHGSSTESRTVRYPCGRFVWEPVLPRRVTYLGSDSFCDRGERRPSAISPRAGRSLTTEIIVRRVLSERQCLDRRGGHDDVFGWALIEAPPTYTRVLYPRFGKRFRFHIPVLRLSREPSDLESRRRFFPHFLTSFGAASSARQRQVFLLARTRFVR